MSLYLWAKESNINLNYSVSTTIIGLTIEYIFGFLFIKSFFFFFVCETVCEINSLYVKVCHYRNRPSRLQFKLG